MNGHEIIERLHAGKRVFSSAMVSTSPLWPSLAKQIGLDFVFVDTEHTPIGRETLSHLCQAYQAMGLPPVVRIPCNDPFEACKALDAGAGGVIGPYVETADQVRRVGGRSEMATTQGPTLGRGIA
jgi:4-hydroxy-2-oxoheptanedioate aldolase